MELVFKPEKRMEVNNRMQQKVGPELFSKLTSTNIGDPYKDRFRDKQLYDKEKYDMNIHSGAFRPGGKQKLVYWLSYSVSTHSLNISRNTMIKFIRLVMTSGKSKPVRNKLCRAI